MNENYQDKLYEEMSVLMLKFKAIDNYKKHLLNKKRLNESHLKRIFPQFSVKGDGPQPPQGVLKV